ncbi:vacuolating cytotoxin domain-containing protein [Helicobacter labacensis]|uniref:vacuolating cytotoxin domain-containing protein n=1 Tax=Helicobacter labacensis TaxID=2316079 RepID=UPI000EB24282|nr:vacuolating cytotoxin domain-containing protein [Helicobacter labacensis]
MKKVHPLSLKFSHALARHIKANQAQRAQLYAFSPRVFESPRVAPARKLPLLPLAPLKKTSKAGALLAGALLAGGPLKAVDGSHNMGGGSLTPKGALVSPITTTPPSPQLQYSAIPLSQQAARNALWGPAKFGIARAPQPMMALVLPTQLATTPAPQNVWDKIYNLGNQDVNVGNGGIAYVDPGKGTLSTWTSWAGGRSFNVNVTGSNQGTLVIGNDTPNVATGGTIWIPNGSIGPIWGTFKAPDIYLTNTFKTGVASGSGKGVMSFDASNNLTMDGLTYDNTETILGGRALGSGPRSSATFKAGNDMNVTNSNFTDNTWGTFNLSAKNTTLTNSSFNGYHSSIALSATQSLQATGTQFDNAYGSTSLSAENGITLSNTSFSGQDNSVSLSSANGDLSVSNTQISDAKQINVNANSASFSDTTFGTTGQAQSTFTANALNFNNTTWDGSTWYNFNPKSAPQTTTTFSGVTTISTDSTSLSPFASLKGTINLSPGAIININQILNSNQNYTLFDSEITSGGKKIEGTQIAQFLEFNGMKLTAVNNNGQVALEDMVDGYDILKIKVDFTGNKVVLNPILMPTDIWSSVYCMGNTNLTGYCASHPAQTTFNVNNGIAFIDPNLKNYAAPYWNPNGNLLNTYAGTNNGINIDIKGEGVLVIGNNAMQAATGGVIRLGGMGINGGLVGYITDSFSAANIYMTNTFQTGNTFKDGGGASVTFNATKNITLDGLNYQNLQAGTQHSHTSWVAGQAMNVQNSNFIDQTGGTFSFKGNAIDFDNSTVQGTATSVSLAATNALSLSGSILSGGYYKLSGASIALENTEIDSAVAPSTGVNEFNGPTTMSGTSSVRLIGSNLVANNSLTSTDNSRFYLSQSSDVNFNSTATLGGSTTLNVENSKAYFNGVTNLNDNTNVSLTHQSQINFKGTTNVGDSAVVNLDQSTALFGGSTNFSDAAYLSLINGSQAAFDNTMSLADNTAVSVNSGSQVNFKGDTTFSGEAKLGINGQGAQTSFAKDATFSGSSSLVLTQQAQATMQGTTTLNSGVNVNLSGGSQINAQTLNLNGADIALMGQSTLNAGETTSTGASTLYSTGNSALNFGPFNLTGSLTLKGILTPNFSSPFMSVKGAFNVGNTGLLNISNVDLFTKLAFQTPKVYDILNTSGGIKGISGADGYQKIDFYGMKISSATYNTSQDSWSFANPLNGAQLITESIQGGKLVVTISQNPNPVATSLYNIAPELYYYKESKQNVSGTQYDYSDNRTGTFFLDSNLKGVFIPPATSMTQPLQPQIPGTYGPYNQPLDPLYIYNPAITQANLGSLYSLASSLWPQLEQLLKNGVLDNLNDPTKVLQALENAHITLDPTQKQELLNLIGGLSSQINQSFANGTLVVGGTQVGKTQSSSVVWFGGNGYADPCSGSSSCQDLRSKNLGQLLEGTSVDLGYIEAHFNAKEIYITGTVGSGNAWQSGGSASVSFNSATNLTLNDATISAQGTDQIFPLLGQAGLEKILAQAGLGQTLGNIIYQKAQGKTLIPSSIQGLGGLLPPSIANEPLGDLLNAQDMQAIMELPGFTTVIKDIVNSKTVSDVFGQNGLISNLSPTTREEIDKELVKQIEAAKGNIIGGIVKTIGINNVENFIDTWYGDKTLWSFMDQFSPVSLDQALSQASSPQGLTGLEKFLNETTFGQILKNVFAYKDLINTGVSWLGPQILSTMMNMVIQDALNPPPALSKMLANTTSKLLNQLLGPDLINTLSQQKDLQALANALMQDKGLGGLWSKGLGSVLSPSLQQALQKVGLGNLLAPKGLSWLWEKGYFSFLANQNVVVNNSNFSNATGGALSFVAGKNIIFSGTNGINFTNYTGTLNFFSNNTSNIEVSTLNATNGLDINAQFNNVYVKQGTLTTNNQYEGISVNAQDFAYLGTIQAKGGVVDLSKVTGSTLLGTIDLSPSAQLLANNLSIQHALNNNSNSAVSIAQDFTLYSGATLTTNPNGIDVGGSFNSAGSMVFNASTQSPSAPFINVKGIATLTPTANTPILALNTQASNQAYTLINAKWIDYNLYNQPFNPNSWKDYLSLYTQLDINNKHMQLNAQGTGLLYNGQAVKIADKGLSVSFQDAQGQTITSSIAYNNIQVGVGKQPNIVIPTIQEYIQQIQGQTSVDNVYQAGGPNVMQWLNALLVETKNTPLFAPYYLENNSPQTLVKIAKDIANSIDLIASPSLKNNSTDILQINTYTQQMSRLAKLSNFTASVPTFHDFLENIKGERFASAVPNAMDVILAYSQRDKIKNNLWMQGVGGASFVAGGTGTLYGINVGYDRFVKGAIVGGYVAYGYSGFHGNITNASSNNVNVGLYSRIFAKNSEITLSANETWGYNKNYINATDSILSIVNQRYNYNTWTTNVGANYGYDFFFKNKSVVLKPQIALRYYYIGMTGLQGTMDNPYYDRFRANADPNKKSVLTLNLALESRHYFGKNSYYFVIADIGRDLFVSSMGDKLVRFIGNDTLSYRKGDLYNTFAGLTMGGEVRLWKSLYINAGIGARFGLDYQDINITGNVGMRYAF